MPRILPSVRATTPIALADVDIADSFWSPRIETVRTETIPFQYHQLETIGHLESLRHQRKDSDPVPHIFWDSDIAKWIEAASYSLVAHPDPELDARLDDVIALLASAQGEDGYLNTYFTVIAPEDRFTDLRDAHELYCAGHLIEAAVAHHAATGKTSLLDVMRRYADLIGTVFGRGDGQIRGYDGHEEIELALVKLAAATGERRYLELASYFVEERGTEPYFFDLEAERRGTPGYFGGQFSGDAHPGRTREYLQAHAPVRDQHEAVGHSVRAMYLYSAMADLAREQEDGSLLEACRGLWEHLTTRRMYVTGGIGSSAVNEGFTRDFDLPDETAYAETCAAIGLMMWAQRMLRIDRHRRYGDVLELALYNGVLSGLSHDGQCFFYDNPMASRGGVGRHAWFDVACCPPNLARLLTSLGSYAYATGDAELVVHVPVSGTVRVAAGDETAVIEVEADVLASGRVVLRVTEAPEQELALTVRIPAWSRTATLQLNGEALDLDDAGVLGDDGYATVDRRWRAGDELVLQLDTAPRRLRADPRLVDHAGRVAVARGPLIHALEEVDNGADLHMLTLPRDADLGTESADGMGVVVADGRRSTLGGEGLYRIDIPREHGATLRLVPYFSWANRGEGEMRIWIRES
ncbi:DUF1680 family protein [Clavibacter sp. B3I6]|uniref:glycoside hydrolase family 127 protein n=1 Tax=Clavibacter sp. B3I6 TaxID=3042268 RepID=UPI0027816CDA|nr:beta-L-arabinofuranosidase domain-containing protein [Clavibacter sp. B3I6]MDQ0745081.1 DUF1680 family protein [Clavibacter sp. B3I6]